MFGPGIKLFSILGFEVKLDFSWVFIATLVVWSLATGYFPNQLEGFTSDIYWTMAVVGMFGLFFSIVFHELAHSLVARIFGLKIKGITLFIFGGMAEMANDPKNPITEFMMAIAGPIGSFILAGIFYLIVLIGSAIGIGQPIVTVFAYLAFINTILAFFNLIPAFPMDGGRVLRSILWHYTGNKAKATHIAVRGGHFFGVGLIVFGIASALTGNFVAGIWMGLIGMFIQRSAASEDFRSDVTSVFGKQKVGEYMVADPVSLDVNVKIQELVDGYFYQFYHDMFPVTDHDKLVGYVTVRDVNKVPAKSWTMTSVSKIMTLCNSDNTVSVDTLMMDALTQMGKTNNGRLMVVQNDRLVGIVTLKDLLGVISIKSQLKQL